MDRRTFLLSAAGAGLGIFVPQRVVSYFDFQSLPPLVIPVCIFNGHTFYSANGGCFEIFKRDGHTWTRRLGPHNEGFEALLKHYGKGK